LQQDREVEKMRESLKQLPAPRGHLSSPLGEAAFLASHEEVENEERWRRANAERRICEAKAQQRAFESAQRQHQSDSERLKSFQQAERERRSWQEQDEQRQRAWLAASEQGDAHAAGGAASSFGGPAVSPQIYSAPGTQFTRSLY